MSQTKQFVFEKAQLTVAHRWLSLAKVELQLVKHSRALYPAIPNPFLNGQIAITGLFELICAPNECLVRPYSMGLLRLVHEGHFSVLSVFILEDIAIKTPSPHRRSHTWRWGGIEKPVYDELLNVFPDEEIISLDDLLTSIGATRQQVSAVSFTAEGGIA